MHTHDAGRATDEWRDRNAGAEAPGDGQTVANYVEPVFPGGGPEPGTVGVELTENDEGTTDEATRQVEAALAAGELVVNPTGGATSVPPGPTNAPPGPVTAPPASYAPDPPARTSGPSAQRRETGLSTKNAPGLVRGRGRPRKE